MTLPARLAAELARIRIHGGGDLQLHRIGGKAALQPYFEGFGVPVNSDYFPFLDLHAAKARFMKEDARAVVNLAAMPIPVLEMLGHDVERGSVTDAPRPWLSRAERTRFALAVRAYLLDGGDDRLRNVPASIRSNARLVRLVAIECAAPPGRFSVDPLLEIAEAVLPFLTRDELRAVWNRVRSAPCHARLPDELRGWLALAEAIGDRNAARMTNLSERLLRQGDAPRQPHLGYLMLAAVAGYLAQNEREQAMAIWREYSPYGVTQDESLFRDFLRSQLFRPGVDEGGREIAGPRR
jgi:hypothetical protein